MIVNREVWPKSGRFSVEREAKAITDPSPAVEMAPDPAGKRHATRLPEHAAAMI
jgi:hypothetical protein